MGILRTITANSLSKMSRGIVVPTLPRSTQVNIIKDKSPRAGVSEYAILDFDYGSSSVKSSQKDPYFQYQNIELLDFGKLAKEDVLTSLERIKETGGLPDKARVVVLNKSLKDDTDILGKIDELVKSHDIVQGLVIKFDDVEIKRKIYGHENDSSKQASKDDLRTNAGKAHVFSVEIKGPEARTGSQTIIKPEALTGDQSLTQTEGSTGNKGAKTTQATVANQTTVNPAAATTVQTIIDPEAHTASQTIINTQADTGAQAALNTELTTSKQSITNPAATAAAQILVDSQFHSTSQVSLHTTTKIAEKSITNPAAATATQTLIDTQAQTAAHTALNTELTTGNQAITSPAATAANHTLIDTQANTGAQTSLKIASQVASQALTNPEMVTNATPAQKTTTESFLTTIDTNSLMFSAIAAASFAHLYSSLTTGRQAQVASASSLNTNSQAGLYTSLDTSIHTAGIREQEIEARIF